jgi:hypothetical protein
VSRNCVAGERVKDEDVVVLRFFVFARQSRVAEYHFRLAFGVLEEGEILLGHSVNLEVHNVTGRACRMTRLAYFARCGLWPDKGQGSELSEFMTYW